MKTVRKIVILLIAFHAFLTLPCAADEADVNDIKVAYIYNFIKYVSWPEKEFGNGPLYICVLENSPLREKLSVLENRRIHGRAIKVVPLSDCDKSASKCAVLVIPKLQSPVLEKCVKMAKKSSTLTISDTPGYASQGVMINLVIENRKVKFEINLDEVRSSALKMSSNLLKLAKIVKKEKE